MTTRMNATTILKLRESGARYLTDIQLLALTVEITEEKASQIIDYVGGLHSIATYDWDQAQNEFDLTDAQTRRLSASIALSTRLNADANLSRITGSMDAYCILKRFLGEADQEHFMVILLNAQNRVIKTELVYKGNINSIPIKVSEILRPAVRHGAIALIAAHNHPSGDPTPSPEDCSSNEQLLAGAKLLQIDLLDHIILGANDYVSLKERRLGGWE